MGPREIARPKDINVNPTKKSGSAKPKPWELEQYIYQEPTEEKKSSHSDDPRLELARHQDQESHFIPSDEDDGYGPPVFGSGGMTDLSAGASSASDLGTLAGRGHCSKCCDERSYKTPFLLKVASALVLPFESSRRREFRKNMRKSYA
jgi:hypothetical protein